MDIGMSLGGALMFTIGAKLIRNNMRVVAFSALVRPRRWSGVSQSAGVLLIDVVNGLAGHLHGPMHHHPDRGR